MRTRTAACIARRGAGYFGRGDCLVGIAVSASQIEKCSAVFRMTIITPTMHRYLIDFLTFALLLVWSKNDATSQIETCQRNTDVNGRLFVVLEPQDHDTPPLEVIDLIFAV